VATVTAVPQLVTHDLMNIGTVSTAAQLPMHAIPANPAAVRV